MNYVNQGGTFIPISYTPTEVDAMFANLPVSQFGDLTADAIPVTVSGAKATLGALPVFFNGKSYHLNAVEFDTTSWGINVTRWVFLQLDGNGKPTFFTSTDANATTLAETNVNMCVGSISTDANRAVTTAFEKVTRIGVYRVSPTKRGSAVPASTGSPNGTGTYNW